MGATTTELGVSVATSTLTSVSSVSMANYAQVEGDLISEGDVTRQAGARVTGTTYTQTAIPDGVEISWQPPLTADSTRPRTVAPDATMTLAPGRYGKLTVNSRARVRLSSGNYAFTTLQFEPDSILDLSVDANAGPVVIYTGTVTAFRANTVSGSADAAESLLLVQLNPGTLRLERSARMAIVAPQAMVELATGGTPYAGSIYAKGIHLEPDVALTYVPFRYWTSLLPPKPLANCIYSAGRGSYVATFGYVNSSAVPATVPLGPNNSLTPAPPASVQIPTTFAPGTTAEALWVPVDQNGVSWTIHGQTATVNLDSPQCQFPGSGPTAGPQVTTEGRPLPRPSIPSVPAPRKVALALENASGPGYFQLTQAQTPPPSGVSDPNLPAVPGVPPAIPEGFQATGTVPMTLSVATTLPGEGFLEGNDLRAWSDVGGNLESEVQLDSTNNQAQYTRTVHVPASGRVDVTFREVEYNVLSDHESLKLDFFVDLDQRRFSGMMESGVIAKNWAFPLPFTIESYTALSDFPVSAALGTPVTYAFHGQNTAVWTVDVPDLSGTVRVCANWTGYFVDEAVPGGPGGFTETFTGTPLDGSLRVRGYPAAFASYVLRVKGAWGSLKQNGQLDEDGCIADVPRIALAYQDSVRDGGAGGISFYLMLSGDFVLDTPAGPALFRVRDSVNFGRIEKYLHLTAFDDTPGWGLDNGIRVPPADVVVTRPWRDSGTTVAGSISHFLRRLHQEGTNLPPGQYMVTVGAGVDAGTKDYQGQTIPDSAGGGSSLLIGDAFFPCGTNPVSPTDCRTACSVDDECVGGQHCAKASDPADGCDGLACFCAWADQGTMKYVTAHEFGHLVQDSLTGGTTVSGTYGFRCQEDPNNARTCLNTQGELDFSPFSTFPNNLIDPPWIDESCGCQHVEAANGLHCIQSIERVSRAETEGFAQFFASLMFNDPDSTTCRFTYYKEVLDPMPNSCRVAGDPEACRDYTMRSGVTASVTVPPVPMDCGTPAKWRNQYQCGVSADLEPVEKPTLGTEQDWMTFLYAVNRQIGLAEIGSIYNHACHPEYPGESAGLPEVRCGAESPLDPNNPEGYRGSRAIAWVDGFLNGSYEFDPTTGLPILDPATGKPIIKGAEEHGGFLSGAERKWGLNSPEANAVDTTGNEHGVSDDITPLAP